MEKYHTGFAIGEGAKPIWDAVNCVCDAAALDAASASSKLVWEERYKEYIDRFLEGEYKKICT